ncbi:class I SAM-dependent methyltransferase [Streptomyces zagrosensis]|uniref:SAM-dependent methyltransferase n=1 Tax=Streptomyces zagrosensis TaxID=1042984 RepID=A0A7W9V017_9ACTN|nr:class I SAM-dependent methyltransferase [Streptomyces zagrosensis]MBB5937352.1 SAM-dependent methyltransferase [Streptomyces zagrosensis]
MAQTHSHSQGPHAAQTQHGDAPHGPGHSHGHHQDLDWATEGPRLVREAELYQPVTEQVIGWLRERFEAAGKRPDDVRRVLDIGSGSGVATCLLAEAFPRAEVVAVDTAQPLLDLVTERAAGRGLGDRVSTLLAELPDGVAVSEGTDANGAGSATQGEERVVAGLGEADLVWSRKVLHHVGDQRDVVQRLARALRPGGLMALTEGGLPMRFLPRDIGLGHPGLQARLNAVMEEWFEGMRAGLPGSTRVVEDWPGLLSGAGLSRATSRSFLLDLPAPLGATGREHVTASLSRFTELVGDLMTAQDIAVLAQLLDSADPEGIARREDAFLLTAETVHTAYA